MTYTACPLGKLTRIAKTNVLTLQIYELFSKVPNISKFFIQLRLDKTYLHPIVLGTYGEVEPIGTLAVSLYQQFIECLPTLVCYI